MTILTLLLIHRTLGYTMVTLIPLLVARLPGYTMARFIPLLTFRILCSAVASNVLTHHIARIFYTGRNVTPVNGSSTGVCYG
jgi:hypothetical protein